MRSTVNMVLAVLAAVSLQCALGEKADAADIPWIWHSSDAPDQARDIAVLLDQLNLSGDEISIRHRMRRLDVDKGTRVTPVVHVQSDLTRMPNLGPRQTQAISVAMKAASQQSTSGWVQLDFEAMESQRTYYLGLIALLRHELPASIKLSVTTLASWCEKKNWLGKLAADEVVPMFFRMGKLTTAYQRRLQNSPEQFDPLCRQQSAGFAVQEAPSLAVQRRYSRRYWFNLKNWNSLPNGE